MKMLFWALVLIIMTGLAWIRFAPSDVEVWHVDPRVTADQDLADGVRRRIKDVDNALSRLDAVILRTPRTDVFAGSVSDGMITYVTRSKWMGLPDFTTLMQGEGVVELYARQRFGGSDLGVNKARVDNWLEALAIRE